MYLTRSDARMLRHLFEHLLEDPEMSRELEPESIPRLQRLREHIVASLASSKEARVKKLWDDAFDYYASDTDEYQISLDDPGATWISKADKGSWISCWAWVPAGDDDDEEKSE